MAREADRTVHEEDEEFEDSSFGIHHDVGKAKNNGVEFEHGSHGYSQDEGYDYVQEGIMSINSNELIDIRGPNRRQSNMMTDVQSNLMIRAQMEYMNIQDSHNSYLQLDSENKTGTLSTNSQRKKKGNIYRFLYESYEQYQKDEQEFMLCWPKKRDKVLNKFKVQTNGLFRKRKYYRTLRQMKAIRKYQLKKNKDKEEKQKADQNKQNQSISKSIFASDQKQQGASADTANKSDLDSMSSADEKDLEILMSGDYNTFFEAYEVVRNFNITKEKNLRLKRERIDRSKKLFWKFLGKFVKQDDPPSDDVDEIERLKNQLQNSSKNLKSMDKKFGFLGLKKRNVCIRCFEFFKTRLKQCKSPMVKKEVVDAPALQKRTGKELWKLARKLVMKKKNNDTNVQKNLIQAARLQKMIELKEAEEKRKQEEHSQIMMMKRDQQAQQENDEIQLANGPWYKTLNIRFFKWYGKLLIQQQNRRLKYFHLVVSVMLFYDFILTGFIMANYNFMAGKQFRFMRQEFSYFIICTIQTMDIMLNFLKCESTNKRPNPREIFWGYLYGNFITDCIAVVPWSLINPVYIFLRYLKLLKYNIYLKYFEEFIVEQIFQYYFNNIQQKITMEIFRLLFQLVMVSHFFGCLWSLIGGYQLSMNRGWIYVNSQSNIQKTDFHSIYIASIYWVITTFASVGYGDVTGHGNLEFGFILIVEMVGICFFGWMIGTFQQLLLSLSAPDFISEEQEKLDHWLMKIDKLMKDRKLDSDIYYGVHKFYNAKFRQDSITIQNTQFFQQLKPRIQKIVLDLIFFNYYQVLHYSFNGCESNFRRDIIRNCTYMYFQAQNQETKFDLQKKKKPEWPMEVTMPVIEQGGQMSRNIYFILSGTILVLDKDCVHEYGRLHDGSYFGEISTLLDEPNSFSYGYNPFDDRSVQCLALNCDVFLKICRQYPISYEVMLRRAWNRKKMFENFKSYTLISIVKKLMDKPDIITKGYMKFMASQGNANLPQNSLLSSYLSSNDGFMMHVKLIKDIEPRKNLLFAILRQYELYSGYVDFKKMEAKQRKEKKKQSKKKKTEPKTVSAQNSPKNKHFPQICFSELCSDGIHTPKDALSRHQKQPFDRIDEQDDILEMQSPSSPAKKSKSFSFLHANNQDNVTPKFEINYEENNDNEEVKAVFDKHKNMQKQKKGGSLKQTQIKESNSAIKEQSKNMWRIISKKTEQNQQPKPKQQLPQAWKKIQQNAIQKQLQKQLQKSISTSSKTSLTKQKKNVNSSIQSQKQVAVNQSRDSIQSRRARYTPPPIQVKSIIPEKKQSLIKKKKESAPQGEMIEHSKNTNQNVNRTKLKNNREPRRKYFTRAHTQETQDNKDSNQIEVDVVNQDIKFDINKPTFFQKTTFGAQNDDINYPTSAPPDKLVKQPIRPFQNAKQRPQSSKKPISNYLLQNNNQNSSLNYLKQRRPASSSKFRSQPAASNGLSSQGSRSLIIPAQESDIGRPNLTNRQQARKQQQGLNRRSRSNFNTLFIPQQLVPNPNVSGIPSYRNTISGTQPSRSIPPRSQVSNYDHSQPQQQLVQPQRPQTRKRRQRVSQKKDIQRRRPNGNVNFGNQILLVGGTVRSSTQKRQQALGNASNQIDIASLFEGGNSENKQSAQSMIIDSPTPRFHRNNFMQRISKSETKPIIIIEKQKLNSQEILSRFKSSLKSTTEEKIQQKKKKMMLIQQKTPSSAMGLTTEKRMSDIASNLNEINNAADILLEIQNHEEILAKSLVEYLDYINPDSNPNSRSNTASLTHLSNSHKDNPTDEPKQHQQSHGHHHHHHGNKKAKQTLANMEEFITHQLDILIQQYCSQESLTYDLINNRSSQGHIKMVQDLIIQSRQKQLYVPDPLPSIKTFKSEYDNQQIMDCKSMSDFIYAKNTEYVQMVLAKHKSQMQQVEHQNNDTMNALGLQHSIQFAVKRQCQANDDFLKLQQEQLQSMKRQMSELQAFIKIKTDALIKKQKDAIQRLERKRIYQRQNVRIKINFQGE